MGIDTVAKLRGNVSTKEICDFISNHLKCKVEDDTRVAQYPTNSHIATYYTDNREKYEIVSGFIRILLPETRSLFYMKINVNFYENLEYYKEKGLEEMVTSETTHVSLGAHGNATEIICALAEHFGGWYCTNDCEDDYVEVKQKKHQDRIDIMVDIETLGKGSNPPVFQIAASAFNIKTGEIVDRFNAIADIDISDIEKDTLLWWLNTNPTLLAELLKQGAENKQKEEDIVKQFCEWTSKLGNKNVFMWGNGILFGATRLGLSLT